MVPLVHQMVDLLHHMINLLHQMVNMLHQIEQLVGRELREVVGRGMRDRLIELKRGTRSLTICHRRGGLELLCDSVKIHNINVDPQDGEKQLTLKNLLSWVRTNVIKERPEMFMKGDSVRPGVLVLVNDADWELSGQLDTVLEEKDNVVFISTLHGG
ncbi:Ubiquitin-related modifier 1 -like protein [Capsicum annuum]|nr:Ubiquitin-related modifier 1 -like protein [Capsicum annuum]